MLLEQQSPRPKEQDESVPRLQREYGHGRSVGTDPLEFGAAVDSAQIRTGADVTDVAVAVEQLSGLVPAVTIPATDEQHVAARVEIVR